MSQPFGIPENPMANAVRTSPDLIVARCCRDCEITDIEPGTIIDGEVLAWADDDICSFCQDRLQQQLESDAARYRYLRDRQTRHADLAVGGLFAGQVPDNKILAGEDLDRAIDTQLGLQLPTVEPLERRLAAVLAAIVDEPLLSGRDEMGGHTSPLDIRLGFFRPELAERAAELLEEAGL